MGSEVYTDNGYRTFTEETPGQLTGKEGYVVEINSNGKVILAGTDLTKIIGVVHGKLEGSNDVTVRLLGKGGTVKCVKSGAIAIGARVKAVSGGKIIGTTTSGDRTIGIVISPTTSGADGDVCEVLDFMEKI